MKRLLVVLLAVVFLVTQSPIFARAEQLKWENPKDHPAPAEYAAQGKSLYTRTHWTKFYINYNGYDLGESGAKYVGALYADVFDTPNDITQGFTGVEPNRNLWQPGNQNDADIENFLKGFQVPQSSSTGHWLVSPAYLANAQGIPNPLMPGTFLPARYVLSNQSGMKRDVPVQKISGSWNVPLGTTVREPVKVSNSPVDTAGGRLDNGYGRAEYWRAWNGSYGARALTQHAAAALYNYPNTSSAVVIASFPYNIFVTDVKKVNDNGSTASYDWAVVNQTPLHLWNITVRVYTKGKKTGKWNLVQVYNNIDIPPAKKDGSGLTSSPQSRDVMVTPSGWWSVARPRLFTSVPKPSEDYDVIVTANVNLNIQSGQASFPSASIDSGMRGSYDAGGVRGMAPPGLPSGETTEIWNKASSILGVSLPRGYNDNVASASDTGVTPPGGGGGGSQNDKPSNLAVINLELLDKDGNPVSGIVEANKPYKVRATFNSSFDFGGWAKVRFYVKREAGWMELKNEESVYFDPKGTVQKTWDWTGMTEQVTLIATVAYRWWDQQSKWVEEPFGGKTETTYDDNKMELGAAGTNVPKGPPAPGSWSYPLYYHPMRWKEIPIYEEYTEPIYGWKKVPFVKEEPNAKKQVRLTE